jgi:hypothetical protein
MLSKKLPILTYKWPVKRASTQISYGGLLMPGITAETDLGVLIQAATTGLGIAGRLKGLNFGGTMFKNYSTAVTDTLVDGTVWQLADVELWTPAFVDTIEYDQGDTMAVASTSTTTVTVTSLEDNIDTSWLYGVGGLNAGTLTFVQTSASGSCVTKTSTGWDSTTTLIKILRLFHRLGKIGVTAGKPDYLGTDAAAGSWTIRVMNNKMKSNGTWSYLDPTKHDGLTGLNATGLATKFYAEIVALSSLAAVAS